MRGSFLSSSGSKSDPDVARFKKITKEINKVVTSFPLTNIKLNIIEPAMRDYENYGNSFLNARSQNDLQLFYVGWEKFCKEFKEIIDKDYFDLIKKFLFEQLDNTTTIINDMVSNHTKETAQIKNAINAEEELREELYGRTKILRKTIFKGGKINLQELSIIYQFFQQYRNEIQRTFKVIFTSANMSDLEIQSAISKVQMFMSKCCAVLSDSSEKGSRLISYVNYWEPGFHSQVLYEKYKTWKTEINRIFGEPLTYKGKTIKTEPEKPRKPKRKPTDSDSATISESLPPRNDDYIEKLLAEIKRLTEENEELRKQLDEITRQYKKLYGKLDSTKDDIKNSISLKDKLEQSLLELQQAKSAKKRIEEDNRQLKAELTAAGACLRGKDFKQATELVSLRKDRDEAIAEVERLKKNLLVERQTSRNALIQGGLDGLSGFASNGISRLSSNSFDLNPEHDPDALFDMYKTALAENDIRRQNEDEALKKLGDFERLKTQKAQLKLDVKELRRQLSEVQAQAKREDPSEDIMKQLQMMSQQILGSQKSADALSDENSKLKLDNTKLKSKLESTKKKAEQEGKRCAELEEEIEGLNSQIEIVRRKAGQEANTEIEKLNNKIEELKMKKREAENELNKSSKEITRLQARLEEAEKTIARLTEEAKSGSDSAKTASQLRIILEQKTAEYEVDIDNERQKSAQLESKVKELKVKLSTSSQQFTEEIEKLKEEKKGVQKDLEETQDELGEQKQDNKKANDKIKELNNKTQELNDAIKELNEKIKKQNETIEEQNENIEEKTEQIGKQSGKIKELNDKIKKQNENIEEQNEEITKQNTKIKEQNEKIQEQNEEITEKSGKIKEQSGKIKDQDQKINDLKEKKQEVEEELESAQEEITKLKNNLKATQSQLSEAEQTIAMLSEKAEIGKTSERNASQLQILLEKEKKQNSNLTKQLSAAQSQIETKTEENENLQKRVKEGKSKVTQLEGELEEKEATINELSEKIENIKKQLKAEKKRADDNQEKIDQMEKEIKKKDKEISSYKANIEELNNKIKELNASIEKFKNDVRSLQSNNIQLQSKYDTAKEKAENFDKVVGTINAQLETRNAFVKLKDEFNSTTNAIIVFKGKGIDREKVPSLLEDLNKKHEIMLSKYNQLVWPRVYHEAAALIQVNMTQTMLIDRMKASSDKLFSMFLEANDELIRLRTQGIVSSGGKAEDEAVKFSKELNRFKKEVESAISKSEAIVGISKPKEDVKERIEFLAEYVNKRLKEAKLVDALENVPKDIDQYKKEIEEENKKYSLIEKEDNEKGRIKVSEKENDDEDTSDSESGISDEDNDNDDDDEDDDGDDSDDDDDDDDDDDE